MECRVVKLIRSVLYVLLLCPALALGQGGAYTEVRTYPTFTALNTVTCSASKGPIAMVAALDASGGLYQGLGSPCVWTKLAAGVSSGTVTSIGIGAGLTSTQTPLTSSGTLSISSGAITNAMLAHSTFTLNGATATLGSSTTLSLASANFVDQGTTTTVLHGNASGNPSFGAVNLTTT